MTGPTEHPRTDLVPYLRGDLGGADAARVEAHLAGCEECRRERDAFAEVVLDLRRSAPEPPPVAWGRWRAELRGRLERPRRAWWRRPVPAALSLSAAAALAALAWLVNDPAPPRVDVAAIQVVEQIEFLEDLEVIGQLDQLAPDQEG